MAEKDGNLNIAGYHKILSVIQWGKHTVRLQFKDVQFRFIIPFTSPSATLSIYGITPKFEISAGDQYDFPSKEYLIYRETKSQNLETWNVRLPRILDPLMGWDLMHESWTPDADLIQRPPEYVIRTGIGYMRPSYGIKEIEGDDLRDICGPENGSGGRGIALFKTARPFTQTYYTNNYRNTLYGVSVDMDTNHRQRFNMSELLTHRVPLLFNKYSELPAIKFYYQDENLRENNTRRYDTLPVGVEKYKVTLELANGESVRKLFDASLAPLHAPSPTPASTPAPDTLQSNAPASDDPPIGGTYTGGQGGSSNGGSGDTGGTYTGGSGGSSGGSGGGSGGGGACFVAGTKITISPNKELNVEDILEGMEVVTYNMKTNKFEDGLVNRLIRLEKDNIIKIILENGVEIESTEEHPYFVREKGWASYDPKLSDQYHKISTFKLTTGDFVMDYNGNWVGIKSIESSRKLQTVYNFEILGNHNYFANGILVHNKQGVQKQ